MKVIQRKNASLARASLSAQERLDKSNAIVDALLPYLKDKQTIGIYMPLSGEVDVSSLLFMYDGVGVPKVRNKTDMDFFLIHSAKDVQEGILHILEPITNVIIKPTDFDVIVVPLVSFDKNKNRIGHGKGYYDRYLKQTNALKVGVAFECQKADEIEVTELDVPLDYIITESNIY